MVERTTNMHRMRMRRVVIAPSSTALLLLLLLSLTQSSFFHVSSFQIMLSYSRSASMIIAPRRRATASLLWKTAIHSTSRSSRIPPSSQLYGQKSTYNSEDVVELQYSEFLPPSAASPNTPVMWVFSIMVVDWLPREILDVLWVLFIHILRCSFLHSSPTYDYTITSSIINIQLPTRITREQTQLRLPRFLPFHPTTKPPTNLHHRPTKPWRKHARLETIHEL